MAYFIDIFLIIIYCITICGTATAGLYIGIKFRNPKNVLFRTSFTFYLGTYWMVNYLKLIYLILNFFIVSLWLYEYYLIHSYIILSIQNFLILAMSIGCLIISCKNHFIPPTSFIFTALIYSFIVIISVVLTILYFYAGIAIIAGIFGLLIIIANVVSFVVSLGVVIASSCCVKNQEKRRQLNYAWITLFISFVSIAQYIIGITVGIVGITSSYSNNGKNSTQALVSTVATIGLVALISEIISLLGSCLIFGILMKQQPPQKSIHITPSGSVASTATTGSGPIGPLMT